MLNYFPFTTVELRGRFRAGSPPSARTPGANAPVFHWSCATHVSILTSDALRTFCYCYRGRRVIVSVGAIPRLYPLTALRRSPSALLRGFKKMAASKPTSWGSTRGLSASSSGLHSFTPLGTLTDDLGCCPFDTLPWRRGSELWGRPALTPPT